MTWEEAVQTLRKDPENRQAILDNYFEPDIHASAERFFQSDEYKAVEKFIPRHAKSALDIGAGRGIASYALARTGLVVDALEPDPSDDVGAGAIQQIARKANLPIHTTISFGESLPYPENHFDIVYVRQVLHHANNLEQFCKEVFRVLKPGGIFIATREHVISKESDLESFLQHHPLHRYYGGEHAYTLNHYLSCISKSGLHVKHMLHPYSSVINFAPMTEEQMRSNFANRLKFAGNWIATALVRIPFIYRLLSSAKSASDQTPGRLYSFICIKP